MLRFTYPDVTGTPGSASESGVVVPPVAAVLSLESPPPGRRHHRHTSSQVSLSDGETEPSTFTDATDVHRSGVSRLDSTDSAAAARDGSSLRAVPIPRWSDVGSASGTMPCTGIPLHWNGR